MNILDYVRIETSTKDDGNMSFSYGDEKEVIGNRKQFFRKKGFEYDRTYLLRTDFKELKQLNNADIINKTPERFSIVDKTDGIITNNKNTVLALLTGDCLQITTFDQENEVLSLIHAGFKWQDAGIIDSTFKLMIEKFNTDPKNVLIHLGNCISPNFYRWDKNIFENTKKDSWIRKTIEKDSHSDRPYLINLRTAAIENLKEIGITTKNIFDSGTDCYTDNKYYSHSRSVYTEEADGRHITVVQMK